LSMSKYCSAIYIPYPELYRICPLFQALFLAWKKRFRADIAIFALKNRQIFYLDF